jgi:hypothetical protein
MMFGNGPGWVVSNFGSGLVNSYLYFAVEFGASFLGLLLAFYWYVWRKILRGRRWLVFYSFFAFVLNIAFIQDYLFLFVPFVFSLLASIHASPHLMFDKVNYKQRRALGNRRRFGASVGA